MKKYLAKTSIIVIFLAILFLPSCKPEKELDFNKVIKEVNQERKARLESESQNDIRQYIYKVSGDREGFTEDEIESLLQPREEKQGTISKENALEDTEYLFKILKYMYGGYGYYGGDEIFNQAKKQVINSINAKEELSVNDLKTIFYEELSFITDGHLAIGRIHINKKHRLNYYCNQEIEIKQNNKGFYFTKDNKKRYLKSINKDEKVEKYLKLAINENGELIYYIGLLQNDKKAKLSLQIEYNLDSERKKDVIKLAKAKRKVHRNPTAFEQKTVEGIPVLICRRLDDKREENTLKYFVETGSKLKNEEVFIIDLRGNGGGSDIWCNFWYENYIGHPPKTGKSSMKRYSKLYLQAQKNIQDINIEPLLEKYDMPRLNEEVEKYYGPKVEALKNKAYDDWKVEVEDSKWVNNDNIIFVLVDKGVASSGEIFIEHLRTLDNVVFVGTNTAGYHDVSDLQNVYLPNSNLNVYLGAGLDMNKYPPYFIDGVGFEPDIWLDNEDMLDRVIKLYNRYNFKQ
ncbi:S41 family peptidase [Dethiothermospora halolimnae]|uniref:S41 family peptidase n=1 Tax=Dethiothermospora halolimnae TaxID=3114390 RepID=UPI003CCC24C7